MASQTRSVCNTVSSQWADPDNAFTENDLCTSTSATGSQNVYNFVGNLFSIPAGNIVYGIVVKAVRGGDADDYYQIELKDDAAAWRLKDGTAYLASCAAAVLETLGGEADLWGGTFSRAHVNSADFQVRLTFVKSGKANTEYVDHIEVTVYYGEPPPGAVVATSTIYSAVTFGFQRKGFYAEGLFWAFYCDGTNALFETSPDGVDWSDDPTSIGACASGSYVSVWFDGTYIHYVRFDWGGTWDTYYRRGTPVNDGTITWCDDEQTVYDGASGDCYHSPCITVDTNGYAWIGARRDDPGGDDFPVVLKNANLDGTWVEDFAYTLNNTYDDTTWKVCPIPLTDGKVYVLYLRCKQTIHGKLYDGGWGAEESTIADYDPEDEWVFSAVAEGDDIHFVYNRNVTNQIRYNKRTYGVGWGVSDVLVQDAVSEWASPVLSIDTVNDELYCFWTNTATHHVYYKKYSVGSWGDLVDWIDESADEMVSDYFLSSYYQDYGDYIGILYVTKLGSPYNVKFAFLTVEEPPEGWTGKIIGVTDPAKIMGIPVADIAKVMGVA